MAELPDLLTALDLYDVPKDVKDAEKLMQEDLKLKERIVNEITVAEMAADYFMTELKEQNPEDSLEMSPATKDYITMMSLLKGMLEELKEKEEEFDKLWALHRARVDHMMRMCHFNRSAAKVSERGKGGEREGKERERGREEGREGGRERGRERASKEREKGEWEGRGSREGRRRGRMEMKEREKEVR